MKLLATAVLSLLLHLMLGWAWTAGAGIAGGAWAGRRGWLVGLAGVALGWGALIAWNLGVAPGPVGTMAAIFGNLPGGAIVALPLVIGALLGALGGFVGSQLRGLMHDG